MNLYQEFFTTALFAALRNQDSGIDVYLILEEMSRGDIASIFGDIFQLLDRDDTGKSMYGINNKSIYEYLILNGAIKPGYKIVIPKNLHIIGTVNTSDQNVNVIDTAFKRRFDFTYVGVDLLSQILMATSIILVLILQVTISMSG